MSDAAGEGAAGRRLPRWARWVIAALVVAVLVAAFVWLPVGEWVTALVGAVRELGAWGVVVFAVAYVAATVLVLPGSVLTLGAGFVYGPLWGTLLVSPVSVLAATAAFLLGRHVFRERVGRRIADRPRLAAIDRAIGRRSTTIVLLLRLSPLVPFSWLNYLLSVTAISTGRFVLASFIGMLPGTVMYVYIGSTLTAFGEAAAGGAERLTAEQVFFWVGLAATVAVTLVITRLARAALAARADLEP